MTRVYVADASGSMEHVCRASSPQEAEEAYLRLVQRRETRPCAVVVDPGRTGLVSPARYRLDVAWPGQREEVTERWRELWAPPGQWTGPTHWQLRSLVDASGVSGSEIARRVGIEPRSWRRYLADPDSGAAAQAIPWSV